MENHQYSPDVFFLADVCAMKRNVTMWQGMEGIDADG